MKNIRNVIQSGAKNLGCIKWCWLLVFFMLVLTGCEHRELSDPDGGHYVRFYLDEQIKNVTCGFYNESYERPEYEQPYVMYVMLADPETGRIVSDRYLQNQGRDERGYYIDGYIGASEGTYHLLAYSFGSVVTLLRGEKNFYNLEAYTSPISEYYLQFLPESRQELDERLIRQQPEHLFHSVEEYVKVDKLPMRDTLRTASGDFFKAHSVAKSYYLQLRVKGFEWVTSAVSTLSGMAGSTIMHGHEAIVKEDSVHLFFSMNYADKKRSKDDGATSVALYTTFTTFGKIPDAESVLTLTFEFMKRDGSSQVEKINITPEFDKPLAKNEQWILLDHEIVITKPEGAESSGGLTPGVDKWEDINAEVQI